MTTLFMKILLSLMLFPKSQLQTMNMAVKGVLRQLTVNGVNFPGITSYEDKFQSPSVILNGGDIVEFIIEATAITSGINSEAKYYNVLSSSEDSRYWSVISTTPPMYFKEYFRNLGVTLNFYGTMNPTLNLLNTVRFKAPSTLYCADIDIVVTDPNLSVINFDPFFNTYGTEVKNMLTILLDNRPNYGNLVTQSLVPVDVSTYFDGTQNLLYVPTQRGRIEYITFGGRITTGDSIAQCSITIYSCYGSCQSCTNTGLEADEENHFCTICKPNHFPKEDNVNVCLDSTLPLPGYYFDVNVFKKCYDTCESCTTLGTINDHKCTQCIANYYFWNNAGVKKCLNTPPEGYYFNPAIPDYSKCNNACLTCEGSGSALVTNCKPKSCAALFFYLSDDNTKCVNVCPTGYVSNGVNECAKCYTTCAACNAVGTALDHNCLTCKAGFSLIKTNCQVCADNWNWYIDIGGNRICTSVCPSTSPFILDSTKQCIDTSCADNSLLQFGQICVDQCPSYYQNVNGICTMPTIPPAVDNKIVIEEPITNFYSKFEKQIEDYFYAEKEIIGENFILNLNDTRKIEIKPNSSHIYSKSFENALRKEYEISHTDPIILVKLDLLTQTLHTNQIEYAAYDKYFNKLNCGSCEGIEIIISFPITNTTGLNLTYSKEMKDKGIDIYDSNAPFFNDICFPYNSSDTDMVLEDRRKDIFVNASFCDANCTYIGIDYSSMMVDCKCKIENELDTTVKDKADSSVFAESLAATNIVITKCFHLIPVWDNLMFNCGCWMMTVFLFLDLCCITSFFIRGVSSIFSKLSHYPIPYIKSNPPKRKTGPIIILDNEEDEEEEEEEEDEKDYDINKHNKLNRKGNVVSSGNMGRLYNNDIFDVNTSKKKRMLSQFPIEKNNNGYGNSIKKKKSISSKSNSSDSSSSDENNKHKKRKHHNVNNDTNHPKKQFANKEKTDINHTVAYQNNINTTLATFKPLNSPGTALIKPSDRTPDLDNCPFTLALRIDKRTVLRIYWDYLKESLFIIRTFVKQSEFELLSVNISVLLFGLALDFTLNALFYTDDIISERYQNKGQLSFWSTILKSIYSCAIGFILVAVINNLSTFAVELDALIKEFKHQEVFDIVCKKKTSSLKMKLNLLFIIEFVLLCCFWYYCAVFCIVYNKSQLSWLEGCGTSFLMSCLTTIVICLVLTIIRVCSFKHCSSKLYYTVRYVSGKI